MYKINSNVPASIHSYLSHWIGWIRSYARLVNSPSTFITGFQPVTPFSTPQFLVDTSTSCMHRYVHMHTHTLQHAHSKHTNSHCLSHYIFAFQVQTMSSHPQCVTSNQLVDSQCSTEPSNHIFYNKGKAFHNHSPHQTAHKAS